MREGRIAGLRNVLTGVQSASALVRYGALLVLSTLTAAVARGLLSRKEPASLLDESDLRRLRDVAEGGRRLAIYDRDTGLYAYWYLNLRLQEEIARADRYRQPFLLLLIEGAGRLPPDKDALVSLMSTGFRRVDLVGVLGNLRFIVLLPNTSEVMGKVIADRIRRQFQSGQIRIGMAGYPGGGADLPSLLSTASQSTASPYRQAA